MTAVVWRSHFTLEYHVYFEKRHFSFSEHLPGSNSSTTHRAVNKCYPIGPRLFHGLLPQPLGKAVRDMQRDSQWPLKHAGNSHRLCASIVNQFPNLNLDPVLTLPTTYPIRRYPVNMTEMDLKWPNAFLPFSHTWPGYGLPLCLEGTIW